MEEPIRVRAKDIIEKIRSRMLGGLEETYKAAYAPARYLVHLHQDDYDNLDGFFSTIKRDAGRALDDDLADLNHNAQPTSKLTGFLGRLGMGRTEEMRYERPGAAWEIEFLPDHNDELARGDVWIESRLDVDAGDDYSGGSKTIRVVERHTAGGTSQSREVVKSDAAPARVYARITYEDLKRKDTFDMTKPQIQIGRGGSTYIVDLLLVAPTDVSREHVHIRYNESSRQFEIKDVSSLGTKVDGRPIPSSFITDPLTQTKKDHHLWEPLPAQARISLADKVFLDFVAANQT